MARVFDVVEYPSEMADELVHRFPETGIADLRWSRSRRARSRTPHHLHRQRAPANQPFGQAIWRSHAFYC